MLKKCIYIFTAFCLLNTIFCFHVGDLLAPGPDKPGYEESDAYAGGGTLLDFLIGQFQDNSTDNENKTPLKIKCRHNHGYFRTVSVNVQAPELQSSAYDAPALPCKDHAQYGNYQICKATLPSYYNFLFRLNLF